LKITTQKGNYLDCVEKTAKNSNKMQLMRMQLMQCGVVVQWIEVSGSSVWDDEQR
jgi:hypothetical protein